MWKKLPNKLYAGLELPIYIQNDDGEYRYECDAILIEPVKSWRNLEPFTWEEKKPEKSNINAQKECWKVMVKSDSPFDNGRKLVRWIPRFHSKGVIRIHEPKEDQNPLYEDLEDNYEI